MVRNIRLSIVYGCTDDGNTDFRLRFESLLFSKEKNNYYLSKVTSGVMVNTSDGESEALGSNPNESEI